MLYFLVFVTGALLAVQAAVNASLARVIGQQPLLATLISFLVGSVVLLGLAWWRSDMQAFWQSTNNLNAWRLSGGLLGVIFVFMVVYATPRIGVAQTLLLVMLGQLLMAALIDHWGWLEASLKPLQSHHYWGLGTIALGLGIYFQGHRFL